jgi:hypothetical protein
VPTVVSSNGHVEKIGKLSDLEMDKWYFFASPETVKRIVEAQKTGNVPPAPGNSQTNEPAPAPLGNESPAAAETTEPQAQAPQEPPAASAQEEKPAEGKPTPNKNTPADITIDVNGNKVNAVDDSGNKMSFSPTVTENNMVLMNGDKSIAVISEDGTQVKTVPNDWEPGAPLDNAAKSEGKTASESTPAPKEEPKQVEPEAKTDPESAPAPKEEPKSVEPEAKAEPEPAPAPKEEPKQVEPEAKAEPESAPAPKEEPKQVEPEAKTEPEPAVQILDEPLDLAKGVPEGFIPKNAVGVILAG